MNVLHVAEYYYANPDFVKLGQELAEKGHRLNVATSLRVVDKPERSENVQVSKIDPLVTLYRLPHTVSFPPSRIYKIVKQHDIEIMHLLNDLSTNAAFASLASRLTDVPYVYTIQGPGTKLGHPLVDTVIWAYHQTIERWIVKRAKKVILLSKSLIPTAKELRVEESRMAVISSGIDPERFDPKKPEVEEEAQRLRDELQIEDSLVLGFLGRLTPVKGLDILFSAVRHIQDEYPNLTMLIVGDGALRESLEETARKLKVKTIFAGWQTDTLPYYSLMDVFVLPSFSEGLANVILEAMAMEKPVVATSVGGNPDIISNGENGFLVPAGDSRKMASALKQLIRDDGLRARVGAQNRQKVREHFSWEIAVQETEKVYSEAL